MHVGILTFHRALNYGAFLQCYALKRIIERMGHQVRIIDYWPKYHARRYRFFKKELFYQYGIKYLIHMLLQWPMKYIRSIRMLRIQKQYFGITNMVEYPSQEDLRNIREDAIVYGSDQIWWRGEDIPTHYDFAYFGDYVSSDKHIAYAASMGIIQVTNSEKSILADKLSHFDAISVREQQLQQYLQPIIGQNIDLVLDPTLLIPAEEWSGVAKRYRRSTPYLLLFNLTNLPFPRQVAHQIGQQLHLQIVEVTAAVRDERFDPRYIQTADALEWLGIIRNAQYVVTSSFHGTAFSLLFEKQFVACGFGNNTDRLSSLLGQLGIADRHVQNLNQLPSQLIDYSIVNPKIERLRQDSMSFLSKALR